MASLEAVAMGNKSSANEKATYLLPWNNQYKAIVGGAIFIGKQYINRGQDTIYLQKFNVTDTSTYSHQYMANVEAANSEAIKLYNGYSNVSRSAVGGANVVKIIVAFIARKAPIDRAA